MRQKINDVVAIGDLVRDLEAVSVSMCGLVDEVHARMPISVPLYLSLHKYKSGSWYLRWRVAGPKNRRPYVGLLFQNGKMKLKIIPPVFQCYIFDVERRAIELNHKHAGILSCIRREKIKQSELSQLSKLRMEFEAEWRRVL